MMNPAREPVHASVSRSWADEPAFWDEGSLAPCGEARQEQLAHGNISWTPQVRRIIAYNLQKEPTRQLFCKYL